MHVCISIIHKKKNSREGVDGTGVAQSLVEYLHKIMDGCVMEGQENQ